MRTAIPFARFCRRHSCPCRRSAPVGYPSQTLPMDDQSITQHVFESLLILLGFRQIPLVSVHHFVHLIELDGDSHAISHQWFNTQLSCLVIQPRATVANRSTCLFRTSTKWTDMILSTMVNNCFRVTAYTPSHVLLKSGVGVFQPLHQMCRTSASRMKFNS